MANNSSLPHTIPALRIDPLQYRRFQSKTARGHFARLRRFRRTHAWIWHLQPTHGTAQPFLERVSAPC